MKKRLNRFLKVRSRNITNKPLKDIEVPITSIYRAGSTTPTSEITKRREFIEINTAESCRISGSKIEMKKRFVHAKVRTPRFFMCKGMESCWSRCKYYLSKWDTGIIAKRYNSSKGNGLFRITDENSLNDFLNGKNDLEIKKWIFERFSTYTKEYRLHITKDGCFYACRKMLKNDAEVRWHRHDENSVWITEENELFHKPSTWNAIVEDCVKALKSVGLDIAAFDIKVQSDNVREPKHLILECNSAPGLGEIGLNKYREKLTELINKKYNEKYGL